MRGPISAAETAEGLNSTISPPDSDVHEVYKFVGIMLTIRSAMSCFPSSSS